MNGERTESQCYFCRKQESELEEFEESDGYFFDLPPGTKLRARYRQLHPHYVGSTLQCRVCFWRPEPLIWIAQDERKLGRKLTDDEIGKVRKEWREEADRIARDEYPTLPQFSRSPVT